MVAGADRIGRHPGLWLALPRVPPPRPRPEKTSDVTALLESIRTFDNQDITQGDQLSYSLHLLEKCDFRVVLLGDLFDPSIVFLDTLVERFDFSQQRLHGLPQLRA